MFKIKKREKIIFFVVLGLIIIFLLEKLVFSNFRKKMRELSKKIKVQETAIRKSLSIKKSKDKIIQDYKDYAKFIITETQDRDIIARFLKEMEKITQDSGLSVVNLAPEEKLTETPEYKAYRANLRLEGTMEQLLNFLNKIQNSTLLIKMDKLNLVSKDEQASALRIDLTVSLVVPTQVTKPETAE
jgi:hypothetical protein